MCERLRSDYVHSQWQPRNQVSAVCLALWHGTDSDKDRMPNVATGSFNCSTASQHARRREKVPASSSIVIVDPKLHGDLKVHLCSMVSPSVVLALGRDSRSESRPGQATGSC